MIAYPRPPPPLLRSPTWDTWEIRWSRTVRVETNGGVDGTRRRRAGDQTRAIADDRSPATSATATQVAYVGYVGDTVVPHRTCGNEWRGGRDSNPRPPT